MMVISALFLFSASSAGTVNDLSAVNDAVSMRELLKSDNVNVIEIPITPKKFLRLLIKLFFNSLVQMPHNCIQALSPFCMHSIARR